MKNIKKAFYIAWLVYLLLLIYFLLLKNGVSVEQFISPRSVNLFPFYSIFNDIFNIVHPEKLEGVSSFTNFFGNIILFIPFGIFGELQNIIKTKDKSNFFKSNIKKIAVFSIFIELLQLITGIGVFDVDDILLNILGGYLGTVLHKLISKIFKKTRKILWFYILAVIFIAIIFIREFIYVSSQ